MDENESRSTFLKALFEHLSNEGYIITETEIENFIRLAYNEGGIFDSENETEDEERLEALLRPLIVKSEKEDNDFHETISMFVSKSRPVMLKKQEQKTNLETKKREFEELNKKLKAIKTKIETAENVPVYIDSNTYEELENNPEKENFNNAVSDMNSEERNFLLRLNSFAFGKEGYYSFSSEFYDQCISDLNLLMKKCIIMPNSINLMTYIAKEISIVKRMKEKQPSEKEMLAENLQNLTTEKEKLETEIGKLEKSYTASPLREIYKEKSFKHRDEFIGGKNAVHSGSTGEILSFDTSFKKITEEDEDEVRKYILRHKEEFKTHLTRYIKTDTNRKIDLPATCRSALKNGGVPLKLMYKTPVRKKARVALILDISGSCSAASELMLFFMYCMRECIPGGCLAYVFINKLYDVTDIFKKAPTPEDATAEVLNTIPRAGAYSNYGNVFKTFSNTELKKLSQARTYTFIIGDARNNKNDPEENEFKKICIKSKKTFWLNTEPKDEWDTGDSIIGIYRKYVDSCIEVQTPSQMMQIFRTLS